MKIIKNVLIIFIITQLLLSVPVLAEKGSGMKPNIDVPANNSPEQVQIQNQIQNMGEEQQLRVREEVELHKPEEDRNASKARKKVEDVIKEIREKKQTRLNQLSNFTIKARHNHGMVVRETVFTLLELANLTDDPGIGLKVREVAKKCNESAEKIIKAEEKIGL